MIIPKQCCMGGHTIKISRSDLRRRFGDEGRASGQLNEIILDETLDESMSGETYLHELIEMANVLCDLHLEHQTITTLGVMLHQALTTGDSEGWVDASAEAAASGFNRYGSAEYGDPGAVCDHLVDLDLACFECTKQFEAWRLDNKRPAPNQRGYPMGAGMPGSPNGRG